MPDQNDNLDGARSPLDIKSILLPKKEGAPSVDSAQRINAGALLSQEQGATLLTPEGKSPQSPAPVPPPPPPVPPSEVHPLQTYQSDIEKVVTDRGVSVVSIAAAEAERSGKEHKNAPVPQASLTTLSYAAGGLLLLAAAGGLPVYALTRPTSLPAPQEFRAPFISVDGTALVLVAADESRATLMQKLEAARKSTDLAVGLVERLYLSTDKEGTAPLSTQDFFATLLPNAPEELVRTLSGPYLLGVHSFDENQSFLLLQVDAYATAYAGMLKWERTIYGDLSPLFVRVPSPRIQKTPDTASSTAPQAEEKFLPTDFTDKVVENRDTRALVTPEGDILMLWTFLGRATLLITTNEYTLRQVISSLQSPAATP